MNFLNQNDYKKGWEEGRQDALDSKQKSYSGMISFKSLIFGDFTMETYTKGYDDGYEQGLIEKNSTFKVQIQNDDNSNQTINFVSNNNLLTNNTNSMSVHHLQVQLQQLTEMEKFLVKLSATFQANIKEYNDKMLLLRQSGMPVEVCDTYDQRYQMPKIQKMQGMIQEIGTADIPYIKKNIAAIQNAINTAK